MADIQVTLVLDDAQYTGKITAATKAAEEFGKKASANAKEASSAFEGLAGKIEGINKKLEGFGSLLVGIGLAGFVKGILEAGEQATKMAEAFGVTTQSMIELNLAASASGIGTEKAANMMNKMLVGAQQASEGNLKLRDALNELGTSTDYLRTHSADEAFAKQVHTLAEMTDAAKRAELAQELFGRAARRTDWKELDGNLQKYNGTQSDAAKSAEDARKVMERMAQFAAELRNEFLKLIDPLLSLGGGMIDAKVAATALLGVMVAFAGLKIAGMFIEAAEAVGVFSAALVAGEIAAAPIIAAIAAVAAVVGGVGYLAYKAYGHSADEAAKSTDKLTEAQKKQAELQKQNVLSGKDLNPGAAAEASLKNQFILYQLTNSKALERVQLEASIASLSQEQQKSALADFDANVNYLKEKLRLQGEINKLSAQEANTKGGAGLGGQIGMLNAQLAALKNQNEEMAKATALRTKAINDAAMGKFYDEEKIKATKAVADLQVQMDQLTMTSGQKSIDNIRKQIIAEQELAQKKMEANLGVGETLDPDKIAESNRRIAESYKPVIDKQIELNQKSREFSTGWNAAFAQYVDDATNAANQGKAMFDSMTSAMNTAIDDFVMKGTFSFHNLTQSILQDMIKIQMKAAVANLMGGLSSAGGNIFSSLFGGHAMGGSIPAGQFGIVGEQGPELVKGPAAVTTANNTKDMMGGTNVTYNIQAADALSFKQMIARDPSFLYAVTLQGQKAIPAARG